MTQIDLDDLPPRVARALADMASGDELVLVRGGVLVSRLVVAAATPPTNPSIDLPPEEAMAEVMEQFKAMMEDEF
jgi:antitoxin (DNA-binding transcriptional repressor) of toxin-antitoxin stability system